MSVIPIYHSIFLALRDQIVNGAYDSRKPLTGETLGGEEFIGTDVIQTTDCVSPGVCHP
ncbi:MAG: hypothetical protein QGH46_04105 [Gammaproteobacteria bacterium]|jgi:hypothetical protein|nr:hypothetical protein [Gammaproteobacteria bacterium]MDP7093470.1 hypothetical protein [Gammaproteobacteria bacterium]MDP7271741.1 hypothetical protein [Gammaproteobacteria bacterium]HJP04523.1 hypothetical protein [Gammaproteobacteria bacterium]